MMKLYNYFRSGTSYRTRIVLNLKGLKYEYVPVSLIKGEQHSAAFDAINPMHGVPVLEVNGARIAQSPAIIEYLEETHPAPPLLPKDPVSRAHVRALAAIVGCDMHPLNNLRVMNYLREEYGQTHRGSQQVGGTLAQGGLRRHRNAVTRGQSAQGILLRQHAHHRRRLSGAAVLHSRPAEIRSHALSGSDESGGNLQRAARLRRRASIKTA